MRQNFKIFLLGHTSHISSAQLPRGNHEHSMDCGTFPPPQRGQAGRACLHQSSVFPCLPHIWGRCVMQCCLKQCPLVLFSQGNLFLLKGKGLDCDGMGLVLPTPGCSPVCLPHTRLWNPWESWFRKAWHCASGLATRGDHLKHFDSTHGSSALRGLGKGHRGQESLRRKSSFHCLWSCYVQVPCTLRQSKYRFQWRGSSIYFGSKRLGWLLCTTPWALLIWFNKQIELVV